MLLQGALHSNSLFHPFQNVSFLLEKCALICICPVFYYLMSSSQETKKSQFHKVQHIDHKLFNSLRAAPPSPGSCLHSASRISLYSCRDFINARLNYLDISKVQLPLCTQVEPMRQPLNYPKGELSHLDYFHRRSLSAERLLLFCRELLTRPQVCVESDQGINRKVSKNFNA